MKHLKNVGKSLTRNEMKLISGGYPGPCYGDNLNCPGSCQANPDLIRGFVCVGNACIPMNCP
ncbi:MAG TPA: hypothetical protein VGC01_04860 [Mucilaginibacter sp.]